MDEQKGGRYFDKEELDRIEASNIQRSADRAYEDKEAYREYQLERAYQLMDQEGMINDNNRDTAYNDINVYLSFIDGVEDVAPQYKESGELKPIYKQIKDIFDRDDKGEWEKSMTMGQPIKKAEPRRGEQEPR